MNIPDLLRQRNFRLFFEGQSVSLLGDQISVLAIPLTAILVLHEGAEQLGLLTAMSLLPSLLFSLVAGAVIDRRGRRRNTMLMADWIRGAAMLSLPVAYALGHLTLVHLYVVAFVVGTLDVLFFVSYNAMIVALVRPHEYVKANALLNGSRSLAGVLGLTLGGALVGVLTAPGALLVDAVSFLYSGAQIARTDPAEPTADPTQSHGISHGARWIASNPLVRAMLASTATVNLFTSSATPSWSSTPAARCTCDRPSSVSRSAPARSAASSARSPPAGLSTGSGSAARSLWGRSCSRCPGCCSRRRTAPRPWSSARSSPASSPAP